MTRSKRKISEEKNPLIIDRPERLDPTRRAIEWGITTIGWVIWFFLVRPLLIVFLWVLGFRILLHQMVELGGFFGLIERWEACIAILLLILVMIRGWNVYNFVKFAKMNRRRKVRDVSADELGDFFKTSTVKIERIHSLREIFVEFPGDHNLKISPSAKADAETISARFIPS